MSGFARRSATVISAAALVGSPATSVAAPEDDAPDVMYVSGIVRDFGSDHPDFNVVPGSGYGHYCGNIATTLDALGKPVFVGGGFRVAREWRDAENRQIAWCVYDEACDDREGKGAEGEPDNGAITSAESFAQWFRTIPGVNMATVHQLALVRDADGFYRFETNDFFPVDDELLGNETDEHNFFFTFEIAGDFVYQQEQQQRLHFFGDDDIWVFIDGRLVIDLGGIAGNMNQTIDLRRLGLEDGESYRLHFFMAERHQPKSQFRLETNIVFDASQLIPPVVATTVRKSTKKPALRL